MIHMIVQTHIVRTETHIVRTETSADIITLAKNSENSQTTESPKYHTHDYINEMPTSATCDFPPRPSTSSSSELLGKY